MIMKFMKLTKKTLSVLAAFLLLTACDGYLDEPLENNKLSSDTDYTDTEQMNNYRIGAYATFYDLQWETFPIIAVRGDDVNAAGDQAPLIATDEYKYVASDWMPNSAWLNLYGDLFTFLGAMEEIEKYKEFAPNPAVADQYKAEIKVLYGFELLQISRMFGDILIPKTSLSDDLYNEPLRTHEEVMQYISDLMDEAIPLLPNLRPNQRTDIVGGVTKHTALAVKAWANLEISNWQAVADATDEIIGSNLFSLEANYYQLFKVPGKLNNENLLELQYSDYGTGSGASNGYLWDFFGPNKFEPAVPGENGGWGFWEPTIKYIQFMIDRDDEDRLVTSVLFTQAGIDSLEELNGAEDLPSYISNETLSGDVIGNTGPGAEEARALFSSGKHYLPSDQITPGRTGYSSGNNFRVIRYAQVLLMHAEAVAMGASSSEMTATEAVNLVRSRAGLSALGAVTIDQVLDEKYAELAMEWGTRFEDLVRHNKTSELNDIRRTYTEADRFLPYPTEQADILAQLR